MLLYKLTAEILFNKLAFDAVEAFPDSVAVIVPAEKLPDASRATTLEAVLADVASTAAVIAAEPLKLPPVRYEPSVRVLVVLAVTVMFAVPSKLVPLIVRAVCRAVAVAALPEQEDEVVALPDRAPDTVPTVSVLVLGL